MGCPPPRRKACKAAGIPTFSPHDLRHRRISLLHLRGVPWIRIGEFVGQRNLSVTADTYSHVLLDERERSITTNFSLRPEMRPNVTACARLVPTPVPTQALEKAD
jgi:integrase